MDLRNKGKKESIANLKKTLLSKGKKKQFSDRFTDFVAGRAELERFSELNSFMQSVAAWKEDGCITKERPRNNDEQVKALTNHINKFREKSKVKANVACIHKGNNAIYKMTEPATSQSVILLLEGTRVNESTVQSLKNAKAPYLPKEYYNQMTQGGNVSVIEFCPGKLADRAASADPSEKIKSAEEAGKKVCEILQDLSKREIIWTDLKSDNILLRKDGSTVIADLKGFNPVNHASHFGLSTEKLLPPKFKIGNSFEFPNTENDKTPTKEQIKTTWNEVYNYQFATILYQKLTGNLVINDIPRGEEQEFKKRNQVPDFDFQDPVFKIKPQGESMKTIITNLRDNKLSYSDAAVLLNHLDNSKVFNDKLNALATSSSTTPANNKYLSSPSSTNILDKINILLVNLEKSDNYSSQAKEYRTRLDSYNVSRDKLNSLNGDQKAEIKTLGDEVIKTYKELLSINNAAKPLNRGESQINVSDNKETPRGLNKR